MESPSWLENAVIFFRGAWRYQKISCRFYVPMELSEIFVRSLSRFRRLECSHSQAVGDKLSDGRCKGKDDAAFFFE